MYVIKLKVRNDCKIMHHNASAFLFMHAKFKLRAFIFDFFLLSDLYVFDLLENASLVIGVVI